LWQKYFQSKSPRVTAALENETNLHICPANRPLEYVHSLILCKFSASLMLFRSIPDSLSPHFVELKNLIDEQKEKIKILELREIDCQDEMNKREKLILDLQNQMISLQDGYDSSTKELKLFADVADETHSRLLEEIEKLHSLLLESTKTITSLHQVFQESSQVTDQMSNLASFNPLDLSVSSSSNLPALILQKLTCHQLPLPSITPLSSMNPYIVISLRDGAIQTGPLAGARSGATIEWIPSELQLSQTTNRINSNFSLDDTITVEIWNQFTLHEAHLVARAEGKLFPAASSLASDWENGKDCESEIELGFVDEHSQALDGTVTLFCKLKHNLFHHSAATTAAASGGERGGGEAAVDATPLQKQPLTDEQVEEYLKSREISLATNCLSATVGSPTLPPSSFLMSSSSPRFVSSL
jgi:hypothetical protein